MFLDFIVSGIETTLMTIEATNVIAMRMQMMTKGDIQAQREFELMFTEKLDAYFSASMDLMTGVSNTVIRKNMRAAVQANELRLTALKS